MKWNTEQITTLEKISEMLEKAKLDSTSILAYQNILFHAELLGSTEKASSIAEVVTEYYSDLCRDTEPDFYELVKSNAHQILDLKND